MTSSPTLSNRILTVDDNPSIHADYRKVLAPVRAPRDRQWDLEWGILETEPRDLEPAYRLDFALQGEQAWEMVRRALLEGQPYRLAFVDMFMPPGWDGLRTMIELRKLDASLQFVICSAHCDYDPDEINRRLGIGSSVLHLSKPFSPDEVREIAFILGTKPDARIS